MTDSELVSKALAQVRALSDERAGHALGVSEGSVRNWRAAIELRREVRLRAPQRVQLERYLAGEQEESADFWRGVLSTHRDTLKAIVATMDRQLSGGGRESRVSDPPEDSPRPRQGERPSGPAATAPVSASAAAGAAAAMARRSGKGKARRDA